MQNPEEIKQLIRLPNEKAWLTNKVKGNIGREGGKCLVTPDSKDNIKRSTKRDGCHIFCLQMKHSIVSWWELNCNLFLQYQHCLQPWWAVQNFFQCLAPNKQNYLYQFQHIYSVYQRTQWISSLTEKKFDGWNQIKKKNITI